MARKEFSSFDSVIDYLKTAPEGTYVDNYDVGNGTLARVITIRRSRLSEMKKSPTMGA